MLTRIFYGWIIVAVIFAAWTISIGPRQAFSVFLVALLDDFGGSRSGMAAVFSVHMAFYALGGWGLGVLLDRLGPKKIIVWSTAAWALTLVASSRLTSTWQLYAVYGVIGGVATSGLAYVPNNTLLSRWFVRYRGLATGFSQASVPLGAALFGPLTQLGVAQWGWRTTQALFGVLVAATSLPLILWLIRDHPGEMGLLPDGLPAGPRLGGASPFPQRSGSSPERGLPRGYWTIFGANVFRGMAMYALVIHQVAYMVDAGFSKMAAASYFSLNFVLAVLGGLTAGAISDRIGRLRTYAGITVLGVVAYGTLLLIRGPEQLLLLAVFVISSGLAWGGIGPVFAALLTDRLQGPRLGFLLGLQNIGFGIGATLGPYLAGVVFDTEGSYALSFLLMAVAMAGSFAILSRTDGRASVSRPRT